MFKPGVGNGKGTLTFHRKTYPFEVSGASFGATLALTVSELEGLALNLRTAGDLAGNYLEVGAGGAIVGGIGVAGLRNGLSWWFTALSWVRGSPSTWLASPLQ